ncbi:MAG: NAD-dependent epimerase [Bdellovibrionota bacterium]|nr:NAD-dependent epimerase [Bdellovibrionota bacterium]
MKKVLITGSAGFIGFHTTKKCVDLGYDVTSLDNLNDYYQVSLKEDRLKELGLNPDGGKSSKFENLTFYREDIVNYETLEIIFKKEKFDYVIHLAAQAGVRFSIENPHTYIKSNAEGFLNILECCRHHKIQHLIYASSSSVYGENKVIPFSSEHAVDHPVSLYAATKRSNELMAHTYSHLYNIPTTGLRFFTVYGPWGRPDMAPFLFTEAILNNKPIKVFNDGNMQRDFTYVDDIVEAQVRLLDHIAKPSDNRDLPNKSTAPFIIYNIGNSSPVNLMDFIQTIEKHTEKVAEKNYMPIQAGDVPRTYADVEDLFEKVQFRPQTSLDSGIERFVNWYREYYKV